MTCYLGIGVQTWVFGDKTDPKPPFFDLVYPLHFWLPATLFLWPMLWLDRWLNALPGRGTLLAIAFGALTWSAAVSALLVWTERRLLRRVSPPISAWVLAGTIVALAVMRLLARGTLWSPGSSGAFVNAVSYTLLAGLVFATYAAIGVGLVVLTARWIWRRADRP